MVRREVTIKPIALFGRPYKVPEAAVVPPCQGGGAELKSRGRHQSSEATRTINGLSRQVEKLAKQLGQARVQSERRRRKPSPPSISGLDGEVSAQEGPSGGWRGASALLAVFCRAC